MPGGSAVTVCSSIGRSGKLKAPASVLCVELAILVAVLVAVILTLGIAAPDGSVTVPVIAPVVVWAMAADAKIKKIVATTRKLIFMTESPDSARDGESLVKPLANYLINDRNM